MKMLLEFVPKGPVDIKSALVQVMTSFSTQPIALTNNDLRSMKPFGITRLQWLK